MTDPTTWLLLVLMIEIPVVGFILVREVRDAFAYHFAGLAAQLETGNVKVHVVNTPQRPEGDGDDFDASDLDADDEQ
jgi:hypothetical protein